jgi:rhamnosyltransferase
MQDHYKVCALIWTYNPDIRLLEKVIKAALENVDYILIVDNGSRNREFIEKLKSENVEIVHLPRNLGVEALNIGFNILTKKETCEWILILDDDSIIIRSDSVREVFNKFGLLPEELKHKIAVISISDLESIPLTLKQKLNILPRESLIAHSDAVIFSGALIKTEILIKHKLRIDKELFLDHADTDFFTRIRKLGYLTIIYTKPLLRHRLGLPLSRPINLGFYIIKTTTRPHRLYYIVRNATYLLLRKRITFLQWILSILRFTIPLMIQSPKTTLKTILTGLVHGILGKKGVLNLK